MDVLTDRLETQWREMEEAQALAQQGGEEDHGQKSNLHPSSQENGAKSRQKRKLKEVGSYPFVTWEPPLAWKFDGSHSEIFYFNL